MSSAYLDRSTYLLDYLVSPIYSQKAASVLAIRDLTRVDFCDFVVIRRPGKWSVSRDARLTKPLTSNSQGEEVDKWRYFVSRWYSKGPGSAEARSTSVCRGAPSLGK